MGVHRHVRLPDFIILGQERWDQVERRNQLLLRALAARNPTARFLFAERALRPREMREWQWPRPVHVGVNIWRVQLVRPLPHHVTSRVSDRIEAQQVARAARIVGLDRPYAWSQDPHAADLLDYLPVEGLVYDLTDDWAAFESDPQRRARVQAQISELLSTADVVLACSRWLCEQARRAGARPVYLPNAIDGLAPSEPVATVVARLPGPRLGYAGTLHGARLDIELIAQAAALRPGWSFVFLGPDLLSATDRGRMFAAPNVHYLGVCPHSEVASYISGFDVALVPNRVTEFTESLDPLKTYEYLAAGLPVIATSAGVTQELADYVHVVSSPVELIDRAQQLIADDGPAQAAKRRSLVAGQTWQARAAVVEQVLGVTDDPPDTAGISIVIVSFNTRDLLYRCLAALHDQELKEVHTIVVDNGSTDGSPRMVAERFPNVELVKLSDNIGFGPANNIGFERCRGEFILLLNSDAFLHPRALVNLVSAARRRPHAAVIGPRLLNPDGSLQRSAWPFPDPVRLLVEAVGLHRLLRRTRFYEDLGIWDHGQEREVDFVSGACLLLRALALKEVGGFDERFYMYAEESDMQQRLRARGWSVILAPTAAVTHVGGGSATGATSRLIQFYAGQIRFLRKHRGDGAAACGWLALLIGSVLRRRWVAARLALSLRLWREAR